MVYVHDVEGFPVCLPARSFTGSQRRKCTRRDMYLYYYDFLWYSSVFSVGEAFFSCFLPHDTQHARRYITRYVWVSPHAGGACTGRRKALGRAGKHFRTTNASIELQKNQTAGRGVFFCVLFTRATSTLHAAELCMFIRRPHSNTAVHVQAYKKDKAVVIRQQCNEVTRATTANKKKVPTSGC